MTDFTTIVIALSICLALAGGLLISVALDEREDHATRNDRPD